MDQAQAGDRYAHDEDYAAVTGGWTMPQEGYQSPHLISPTQEYQNFSFSAGSVPVSYMHSTPTPPMPQPGFVPTWPSMLTTRDHHHHHQQQQQHQYQHQHQHNAQVQLQPAPQMTPMQQYVAPQPLPPLVTTASAHPSTHRSQQQQQHQQQQQPPHQSSSRRTLTDQDRRRMCIYHEENPTVKQTEIGAMFGVERSTVSKVLRQKEKYLAIDDGSKSPVRRPGKGKFPDIERALANWVSKHQHKGMELTDDLIRDRARFFAASVGNPEASMKVSSPSWLEKFKQKNQIGALKHKGLKASASSADLGSSSTLSGISPISPGGGAAAVGGGALEPSPLTPGGTFDGKPDSPATDASSTRGLIQKQSSKSLYSDASSTFTTSSQPPMPAPYTSQHAIAQMQATRMMPPTMDSQRPRSQTFPMLGIEATQMGGFTEAQMEDFMNSSVLETPQEEHPGRSLSVASISSSDLRQLPQSQPSSVIDTPGIEHSPPFMGPPSAISHPASITPAPMAPPVGAPTLDDGRRGLQIAMGYLTSLPTGMVDPQDFMLLGKLMEKLNGLGSFDGEMPGGMHAINVKKEMSRQRSIQSL